MSILLSSEVAEEIEELHMMVRGVCRSEKVVVHAPTSVVTELRGSVTEHPNTEFVPLKHFRPRSALFPKVWGILEFVRMTRHNRPRLIISGPSMMKHRVASRMFRTRHVEYLRSLYLDPTNLVGFSDYLRFRLFRGRNIRLLNSYDATEVLTVASISTEFVVDRGVDRSRIASVGPVWLKDGAAKTQSDHAPRVYFISQAHSTHGDDSAHAEQLRIVADLAAQINATDRRLYIRVHPRDFYPYETDPRFDECEIDRDRPGDFLAGLGHDDVLLSPLSTLAFEALHLGHCVVFVDAPGVTDRAAYERLGIDPVPIANAWELLTADEPLIPKPPNIFDPINFEPARIAFRAN